MVTAARLLRILAPLIVSMTIIGSAGASSNGLFYNQTFEIEDADSGRRTIELDSSGNIYASFGSNLYKLDAEGILLHEHEFSNEITATAISPDYSKLAVTVRTATSGVDSIFVLSTGDLSTLVSNEVTRTNAYLLEWSPNGAELYANAPNNGILQLNKDTLEEETSYVGNHSSTMACLDVSETSGSVLTADTDGLIQLWNNDGDVLHHEIMLQSTIHDCQIGHNDEYFSISTPDNGIRKWTFSGSELKPIDINNVLHYELSSSPNTLFVHKSTPSQHILTYDVLNEQTLDTIMMFHTFDDYEVVLDQSGTIAQVYTNSKVDHIVIYGNEVQKEGVGESGTDTDGDGVPDSLDKDDDGDGIEDNWDLNCPDIGIPCELLPDEDFIRNIDILVNSTHISIVQTFTLNKAHSASIRDLARYSVDMNIKLSEEETQLFANSICGNMNEFDVGSSLASAITVGDASLNFSDMTCVVEDGMVLYPTSDRTSHIRYSINVLFEIEPNQQTDGLSVQIQNHRFNSDGSLTELSEQHPLSIHVYGDDITEQKYVPWHIQENQVSFTLVDKESNTESLDASSIFSSPVLLLFVLLGIVVLALIGVLFSRRQSERTNYDIVLDEDEDEDDYDESEEDEEFEDFDEEIEDDSDHIEEEVKNPRRQVPPRRTQTPTKRVPVRKKEVNDAQQLLQDSSDEVIRKRRARRSDHDTVRTKRRKLSDTSPVETEPRRRRAVKNNPQAEEDMDETLRKFVSDSPEE
ncbi:MAG: hypothetical protein ACPIC5_01850 [Candidatus Poseidoniaceae archaeon]